MTRTQVQTSVGAAGIETCTARQQRIALVRRWGTFTQAYSTAVQPGLEHFWHDGGYLAYRMKWRVACVIGDPVARPDARGPLVRVFLDCFPKTCFWQIGRETAQILADCGFWINEMGCDTRLELAEYDFTGKKKERLRHATNWLTKHNFQIRECLFSEEDGAEGVSVEEIRALSDTWQASRRTQRTVHFFNRPIVYDDEPDVRKFFLFSPDGRLVAFVFFDPIYRDGEVIGYSPAIKRRLPDAPLRAEEGMMKTAIEQFQQEGREVVMLGLSPMAGIENKTFRGNPFLNFSWRRGLNAWWLNRYFYNLRGHADFKRRFDGREEQTYYASDVLFNDLRIIASLRMAGAL